MRNVLHSILGGSSPITGYLGSAIMALDVVNQAFVVGGIPTDVAGWISVTGTFLTGLAVRFAKDANKSNAPVPTAEPVLVR